jgi:hypothetical protein
MQTTSGMKELKIIQKNSNNQWDLFKQYYESNETSKKPKHHDSPNSHKPKKRKCALVYSASIEFASAK